MSDPAIILYGYTQSPFYQKMLLVLLFKKLPYKLVKVQRMPPRPELELLGITYRRIPVLAIGGDVYCDTALAIIALEERFPGKGLDLRSGGIQSGSSFFWADRAIFRASSGLMPLETWSPDFVVDRTAFAGAKIDPVKMQAARPLLLSNLRAHVLLIENQLATRSSTTKFLLDTLQPTLLDLSFFFTFNWVDSFGTADSIFKSQEFPLVEKWIESMRQLIAFEKKSIPKATFLTAAEAATIIHAAATPGPAEVTSMLKSTEMTSMTNLTEPLLVAGWFKLGDIVDVTPDDTGRVPQRGSLVSINSQRIVLRVVGESGSSVLCHFPRLGFGIGKAKVAKM